MKSQGLPVNMIVLTALALLVLIVVASWFITQAGRHLTGFDYCSSKEINNCLILCESEHMEYKDCNSNQTIVNCNCSRSKGYIINEVIE